MDESLQAFERFVAQFNAWPDALGHLTFNAAPANLPAIAEMPQAGLMRRYFEHIDLSADPMIGADFGLELYGPLRLEKAQQGWHVTGSEDAAWGWKEGFTVFADRNGDVLVYDRHDACSAIYGSIQKRSFKVASDIVSLLNALQAGIKVQLQEFNDETLDDDMSPKPAFLDRVRNVVGSVEGADVDGFMKFFFE